MALVERSNAGLHLHVAKRVAHLDKDRCARILDLGCGTGAFLTRLHAEQHTELNGVDIKRPDFDMPGIIFSEADLDSGKLEYEDNSFDIITSIEVFEHIENIGMLLKEISRILKPEGTLLITTPNVHSIEARLRFLLLGKMKQFDELSDPTHIFPIFLFSFERLLKRHSLKILTLGFFPEDGSSPTTNAPLRILTAMTRMAGLRGLPAGDHLSLAIGHEDPANRAQMKPKAVLVTQHY